MHKNIAVADVILDEATATISRICDVYDLSHIPVGIAVKKASVDRAALNEWWVSRAIPISRIGIERALSEINITSAQKLTEKSFGLSLSDQYWITPKNSSLRWSDINFFDNPFSEDMGNILFGEATLSDNISLISPDNTSDGWLKKKWRIINDKRCLIKGGSGATQQEPYNEVIASLIMDRLGTNHVKYELIYDNGYPYSVCEDFITKDTELISAYSVLRSIKKPNNISLYEHFINCCETLGIPNVTSDTENMLIVDYLISNADRHQNNFGFIRNAESLEWLGMAPIYDSGTSLWFDKPNAMISAKGAQPSKPFKNDHAEQIKLIKSFNDIDLSKLKGIEDEVRELFSGSAFIDENRADRIVRSLGGRIEMLKEYIKEHENSFYSLDSNYELEEDIAYSGSEEENEPEI